MILSVLVWIKLTLATYHRQDRWVPTSGFQTGDLQPVAPQEMKHVLTLVCVIKPMCAWNLQVCLPAVLSSVGACAISRQCMDVASLCICNDLYAI